MNKTCLIGRLGRDPEFTVSQSSISMCRVSIAVDGRKDQDGNKTVQWFKLTFFKRQAEIARDYLRKGHQVYVEGPVALDSYEDKDGNQRTNLAVTVNELQLLASPPVEGAQAAHAPAAAARPAPAAQTAPMPWDANDGNESDDVPF